MLCRMRLIFYMSEAIKVGRWPARFMHRLPSFRQQFVVGLTGVRKPGHPAAVGKFLETTGSEY